MALEEEVQKYSSTKDIINLNLKMSTHRRDNKSQSEIL